MQTREDAHNKSSSNKHLANHVATYSLSMSIVTLVFLYGAGVAGMLPFLLVPLYWFIPHFIIDYITSRWSSKLYKSSNEAGFWGVIGLDQFIHQIHILLFILLFL